MKTIIILLSIVLITFGFKYSVKITDGSKIEIILNDCNDVLKNGFYDIIKTESSGNYFKDMKGWLTSDSFKEYIKKRGGGFNITVPIEGVPVSFGGNASDANYQRLRDYLNQGSSEVINQGYANFVSQQIVNDKVIDAWKFCIDKNNDKPGLQGYIERGSEKSFILFVKFVPLGNTYKAEIRNIYTKNIIIDSNVLSTGTTISTQWIRVACEIDSLNYDASITINTDNLGSFSQIIPKTTNEIKTKNDKQLCQDGDCSACEKISKSISDCGPQPSDAAKLSEWMSCRRKKASWENVMFSCNLINEVMQKYGAESREYSDAKINFIRMFSIAEYGWR